MVDVSDGYSLSQEFSACNQDLSEANQFLDAYNAGEAYYGGISDEFLFYESEQDAVLMIPIDDLARLYSEQPEAFDKMFEEQPGAKGSLDEAVKALPYCGPDLIGSVSVPSSTFS